MRPDTSRLSCANVQKVSLPVVPKAAVPVPNEKCRVGDLHLLVGISTAVFLEFSRYTILWNTCGSLRASCPFHTEPTLPHDVLPVRMGVEVTPTVQKNLHEVLREPSQARSGAADS